MNEVVDVPPPRKPREVIDQLLAVIIGDEEYKELKLDLESIKESDSFRAPELNYVTWQLIQEALQKATPASGAPNDYSDTAKKLIRVFTNDPNII